MKKCILLMGIVCFLSLSLQANDLLLWYKRPANTRVEALLIGNFRIGMLDNLPEVHRLIIENSGLETPNREKYTRLDLTKKYK